MKGATCFIFLKRKHDLTLHLPSSTDASAATRSSSDTDTDTDTCWNDQEHSRSTGRPPVSTFANTQIVKPCHSFYSFVLHWISHGTLICWATETRYKSPCQKSLPSFIPPPPPPLPYRFSQYPTPKDPFTDHAQPNHVVLHLLAVKDNRTSTHGAFHI